MRSFVSEPNLADAIFELRVTSQNRMQVSATAWLATDSGYLCSCGHPFWELLTTDFSSISAEVRWAKNTAWLPAEVQEIGEKNANVDYSILKVDPDRLPADAKLIKISGTQSTFKNSVSVLGCGFPKDLPASVDPWDGRLLPGSTPFGSTDYYKISCSDDSIPEGCSGGPILLLRQSPRASRPPIAVGIQAKATGSQVRYALPLRALSSLSCLFRQIYSEQNPLDKFELTWLLANVRACTQNTKSVGPTTFDR